MAKHRLLQQLGVLTCLGSSLIAGYDEEPEIGRGLQHNIKETRRVEYASGAGRSMAGWTVGTEEESSDMRVLFKVHLRQCNLDRLEEDALAVSDLDSPRYGKYLSAREVCEVTSCPGQEGGIRGVLEWLLGTATLSVGGQEGGVQWEEGEWLGPDEGGDDVMAKVLCSHVVVSMSAAKAAETFPEAAFRSHRRTSSLAAPAVDGHSTRGAKRGGNRAVLRATGPVLVPESLVAHVEFVSGLTELWAPDMAGSGMGKLDGGGARRFGSPNGMEAGDFTEVMIQPRTLRTLYGVPDGERGDWAGQGNNRQGIVAFNNSYLHADLCAAHNLLAPDSDWLNPPDVTDYFDYFPGFDPEVDASESDLDTQYMTLMGPGVPVTFATFSAGEWILDWALKASEDDLTPDRGGPLVWSISYGFPEAWTCFAQPGICNKKVGSPHGYDPSKYLNAANEALKKLVTMGVSVLVSSGDDGAGLSATCPVDPKLPVDFSGGTIEEMATACPFEKREDCNCGSFEMQLQAGSDTSRCILPLGLVVSSMGIEAPGADCVDVLDAPDCQDLLAKFENGTLPLPLSAKDSSGAAAAPATASTSASAGGGRYFEAASGSPSTSTAAAPAKCQMAFDTTKLSFFSDCKCTDVGPIVEGSCSLSGYSYQLKGDGAATPFNPGFPASSPWVTSVGATQVAWDLQGACLQSDLLGPGNSQSAETAVNKFTGGFDGGGGFSTTFGAPAYQAAHTQRYVASKAAPDRGLFNSSNRGFPDISAVGHNFVVVINGRVEQIEGTSASAPALAGMVSLMNERLLAAGRPPLGFLNPALYKAAEDSPATFQSIFPKTYNFSGTPLEATVGASYQVGSNKCSRYSCCELGYGGSETGDWDPVTGLGTINYQALSEYLNIPPSPPRPQPGGGGHDRHHAAYVAWIVVLVFALISATILLVYEHRPKLMLSAATLGRSMRNMGGVGGSGGDGGGVDEYQAYEAYERSGGWNGGVSSGRWSGGGGGGGGGRKPRGALTEMVMGSDGMAEGDAAYRLLEESDDFDDDDGGDRGGGGRDGGGARRSV